MPRLNGVLPGIKPQGHGHTDMGIAAQMLASPDAFGLYEKTRVRCAVICSCRVACDVMWAVQAARAKG